MVKQTVTAFLSLILLSACGHKKSSSPGGASPACDLSKGDVSLVLAHKIQQAVPGTYQFVEADYVHADKGVSFLVNHKFDGQATQKGQLVCPAKTDGLKALDKTGYSMTLSDTMIINAAGQIEVPNQFLVLTEHISFADNSFNIRFDMPKQSSLQQEGVNLDEIRQHTTVIPVKDGIVLEMKDSGHATRAYYRLAKSAANSPARPGAQTAPPPQATPPAQVPAPSVFTKEQCLEKTGLKLGSFNADYVRFPDDCSTVVVTRGKGKVKVGGTILGGIDHSENCRSTDSATVQLMISNSLSDTIQDLKILNPNLDIRSAPMPSAATVSWSLTNGADKMIVMGLGGKDDAADPNRSSQPFNGAVSAKVTLGSDSTCRLKSLLKDSKNHLDELSGEIIKLFGIEVL